jgi:diguanylate cyclase (GGDEF)-like protein
MSSPAPSRSWLQLPGPDAPPDAAGWLARLLARHMPDYNRAAATYWLATVLLGSIALAMAGHHVARLPLPALLQVIGGALAATAIGLFPVRIPRSRNSIAAGEIFIFVLLLLHGGAAATLAAAGEAAVGSMRTSARWTSRIASPTFAALSMAVSGALFDTATAPWRAHDNFGPVELLLAVMAFAIVYFALNTMLMTLVITLKRGEALQPRRWLLDFGWVGIAYSASASIATLIYLSFQHFGGAVLVASAPIVAMFLALLRAHFGQIETDERARRERVEAAEREVAVSVRHAGELEERERQLRDIAFNDSLTGLANRRHFHDLLSQAIERCRHEPGRRFALLYLDFDRFKLINDSLGHTAGDEFLVKAARCLCSHVRPGDIVARLGGDEFAILVEDVGDASHAETLALRIQQALREPLMIAGTEFATSASIGITFSDFNYGGPTEVLRDADIAMYRAKSQGKARHALFDASLRAHASEQLFLEGELRRGLVSGQMSVAYQPLFKIETGELYGFEALARWHHPQRGTISPATFVPIAEESDLILMLSNHMLDLACRQLRAWQLANPRHADLRVHVNISGHDLCQPNLASRLTRLLLSLGLRPSHVTLEITENTLMQRLDAALDTMNQLRELGVGLSVDDFGTGYSSLSYLTTLPINSLKIDSSFVQKMHSSAQNSEIVRAVVTLGSALGKLVIAEGVETPGQLAQLRSLGCEFGQGYHFSRPLSALEVGALLRDRKDDPETVLPVEESPILLLG